MALDTRACIEGLLTKPNYSIEAQIEVFVNFNLCHPHFNLEVI